MVERMSVPGGFSDMPRQPDDVRSSGVKQTSRRKAATSVS
jgi:hypothetical protein